MALLKRNAGSTESLPKFLNWIERYPNRIPEIYGIFIAVALILYFIASYTLGFAHTVAFRILYFPILVAGIYYAIKQFKKIRHTLRYYQGFMIGLSSSVIGMSVFVLFLFIMFQVEPDIFAITLESRPAGLHLSTYMAAFIAWMEGIFSGFMATFLLMIFFIESIDW